MKQTFNVSGMTCSACSAHVEKAVGKVEGVSQVSVNLLGNSMQVTYDESAVTAETIMQAVAAAGYGASLPQRAGKQGPSPRRENAAAEELDSMKRRGLLALHHLLPLLVDELVDGGHGFLQNLGVSERGPPCRGAPALRKPPEISGGRIHC